MRASRTRHLVLLVGLVSLAWVSLGPSLEVLAHSSFYSPIDPSRSENSITRNYDPVAVGGTVGLGVDLRALIPLPAFVEVRYAVNATDSLSGFPRTLRKRTIDVMVGATF